MPSLLQPYLPKDQIVGRGWCGPTCLANAMAIYGLPSSPEACAGACGADHENGTSNADLCKGIKALGFRPLIKDVRDFSNGSHLDTIEWVRNQTNNGKIVVCAVNGNYELGHYILILRVPGRGVQVWDPNDAFSKIISRKNLYRAWVNRTSLKDPEIDVAPSQIWLCSLSPRSRLARRAVEVRHNLMFPRAGKIPIDKDIPVDFPSQEDVDVVKPT